MIQSKGLKALRILWRNWSNGKIIIYFRFSKICPMSYIFWLGTKRNSVPFLLKFSILPFCLEIISTNMTMLTWVMWSSMWKSHLWQCIVKSVGNKPYTVKSTVSMKKGKPPKRWRPIIVIWPLDQEKIACYFGWEIYLNLLISQACSSFKCLYCSFKRTFFKMFHCILFEL